MSYRVDIPTLSANEVYTLTFEYEGTETIQLIVGDLTLETTDRRVVFTTTSPVNYIESNMNLTNLNVYEGYYESDDFGGEYTQESYIEGKSLVNLCDMKKHVFFQNNVCGTTTYEDNAIKLYISDATTLTSTWQHAGIRTSFGAQEGKTYTCIIQILENTIKTDGIVVTLAGYGTVVHGEGSVSLANGETGTFLATVIPTYNSLKDYGDGIYDAFCRIGFSGDWVTGGSLKYRVMIFEGDHYDDVISGVNYFTGIGCVKSPKIVSYPKYPNIAPNCKRDLTNVTPTAYRSDDNSYIKITNTARWVGVSFGYYPQDFGYGIGDIFCLEFDVIDYKGTGTISNGNTGMMTLVSGEYLNSTGGVCYIDKIGHYKEYFICNGNSENGRVCLITVHLNTGTGGINTLIEIDNLKVYKIDSVNDINEYEEGVVSTPDDLELYKVSDTIYDKLDLTTGTLYKNTGTYVLDETFVDRTSNWNIDVHATTGNVTFTSRQHSYLRDEHNFPYSLYNNAIVSNADPASNIVNNNNIEITRPRLYFDVYSNNNYTVIIMPASYNVTTLEELRTWLQNNPMIFNYKLGTPYTEQLSLNPLKSYYNGSIQTSSQQLAPTLKTTLPISNKFTTTNLTSGSTYNVYFDGTATKLDAGGTIITNPVSPCEVECGGTTLTIEGTDIQNVRVLETTIKNEVGNNGTSDVELSRIKTANSPSDSLISTKIEYWEQTTEYGNALRYVLPIQVQPNTKYILNTTNIQRLFAIWDVNGNVLVNQNIYVNSPYIWTTPADCPSEVYLYLVYQTDVNRAHLDELRMFEGEIDFGYQGQQEPLISQTISKLEQPIKLRSLGTTYDSYNPVTGELIKRIGVSETDGSYSVLSSPIVSQVEIDNIPHLYTNGQVKVYSESEVYPTTILNGQSTNNYEVNELNRYNNYTIRYDGTCESINLNGKSNEPGTNRIVKTSTDGRGNLTFVNDNGDINNVLLVEHDVREQEINHFNGLQTVEVCKMIVQSPISKHLFYNYGLNDFVPGVNTNYSFDENNNLVLSNGYGNNVDTMLQTVDKYTLEKGDSVIFRVVGIENFAADHRLMVKLATQTIAFGGYYAVTYVNFNGPKVQEIINEQGYCDVVYTYNSETTTDNIQISNYFGKWIISSVVLCKQSQEIITPIIIDLPQPVQLNRIHKENMPYSAWSNVLGQNVKLADGIAYDSYNPITGEYIQRVYKMTLNGDDGIKYIDDWSSVQYAIDDSTLPYPRKARHADTVGRYAGLIDVDGVPYGTSYNAQNDIFVTWLNYNAIVLNLPRKYTNNVFNQNACKQWLRENPITLYYELETPIVTQLTPINIPTFEGGIVQLITTDGKVFPMIEYSMPTNNRYDTSSWETGVVYTQRNMTEAYFNDSTTPMTPTETMTLTTDHISGGSIILNDNGNGLIVLKGNYTGRDIPYFTGMRSVESIEVEVTPSPEQPIFGKGGRK